MTTVGDPPVGLGRRRLGAAAVITGPLVFLVGVLGGIRPAEWPDTVWGVARGPWAWVGAALLLVTAVCGVVPLLSSSRTAAVPAVVAGLVTVPVMLVALERESWRWSNPVGLFTGSRSPSGAAFGIGLLAVGVLGLLSYLWASRRGRSQG